MISPQCVPLAQESCSVCNLHTGRARSASTRPTSAALNPCSSLFRQSLARASVTSTSQRPVALSTPQRHGLVVRAAASHDAETAQGSDLGKIVIPSLPHSDVDSAVAASPVLSEKARERMRRVKQERATYLVAAIASSIGVTCLAAAAVAYRFMSQMQDGGEVPVLEIFGTFALAVGAAVGMEFWARWAHKALWHGSLWHMHESHHKPREGPFELNDVFAIINAGPAIGLLAYGFFFPGLFPGLCFGAGLGITVFGMAYMFVHDGLVHRRFPVGPIADVPYFQRVAAAHQLHHADKFEGVPFGLFLGPQELEEVGGSEDLSQLLESRRAARAEAAAAGRE